MTAAPQRMAWRRQHALLLVVVVVVVVVVVAVLAPCAQAWTILPSTNRPRSPSSRSRVVAVPPMARRGTAKAHGALQPDPHGSSTTEGDGDMLGPVVRAHTALMQDLCPALESCRVYLPWWEDGGDSSPLLLDDGAFAAAFDESTAIKGTDVLGRPVRQLGGHGWLVPLHAGTDTVEIGWACLTFAHENPQDDDTHRAQLSCLESPLHCLAVALRMAALQQHEVRAATTRFVRFLQAVRTPLGALRTFSKLLIRRLERDPEGLNFELAQNVLVQSDQLVELLLGLPPPQEGTGSPLTGSAKAWESMADELEQEASRVIE